MKISFLLHTFLEMPWGFMCLFNLGMILEQSEWFQDDHLQDHSRKNEDERIGKLLVTDFKFFWNVLTVVWNKQTVATQKKNPSSTVSGIVDKSVTVGIGRQGGVKQVTEVVNGPTLFARYEGVPRSFAAWYSVGLTLETLAEKMVDLASSLTTGEVGMWTQAVRNALPVLLNQIFA